MSVLLERVHGDYVYQRRVRVLSRHLAELIPASARVLDVGCGDGLIDRLVGELRPDVIIEGIDPLVRERAHIPVRWFDGRSLPYPDGAFDAVVFVDALHHSDDPAALLGEAARIARAAILIKDHLFGGFLAGPTLRFMDWVGNARHDVALPYNYWPERRWREAFDALGLRVEAWRCRLGLYPRPSSWVFERSLHFVARLALGGQGRR